MANDYADGHQFGNFIQIRVIDTGIGISKLNKDKIFQEFYREHQTNRHANSDDRTGLGIGLSISAGLAVLLNTQIQCFSRVGLGSMFYFDIPLSKPIETDLIQTVRGVGYRFSKQ